MQRLHQERIVQVLTPALAIYHVGCYRPSPADVVIEVLSMPGNPLCASCGQPIWLSGKPVQPIQLSYGE